jgi:branched-chain amino acid transport system substrate-binding protein
MKIRTLGIIGAAGLLAVAAVVPASAQPPEDSLRVVEIPAGEPLVIGTWGVQSGADASLGQDWMNSVAIAADDRDNMFMGHEIQIVTEDGLCTPEGGATAAQKLAANSQLVGLIGSACSDETVGGIATLTNAGLTTISPSNTRPALTAPDRGAEFAGYLRTAHSDAFQGKAVAEFVYNELGLKNAATIHDGSAYGQALQQVFADEFTAMGGTITVQEAVQKGQTDMKPVLTAVAATNPEVIYFPIFTAEGGAIAAQSKEVAGLENAVLIGSDGMFSSDFVKAAGPAANGMYLSSPNFSAFQAGYADLLTKYKDKFGINPPQAFHAHGYDATNILFAALDKVAVQDGDTLYVPLGALRDAIYATTDFQGVTGVLSCSETGDCGAPLIAVYQIGDAEIGGSWPPAAPIWPTADAGASPAASAAP